MTWYLNWYECRSKFSTFDTWELWVSIIEANFDKKRIKRNIIQWGTLHCDFFNTIHVSYWFNGVFSLTMSNNSIRSCKSLWNSVFLFVSHFRICSESLYRKPNLVFLYVVYHAATKHYYTVIHYFIYTISLLQLVTSLMEKYIYIHQNFFSLKSLEHCTRFSDLIELSIRKSLAYEVCHLRCPLLQQCMNDPF